MIAHADKPRANMSGSATPSGLRSQGSGNLFVDDRPEIAALRSRHRLANDSPRVRQLNAFQRAANNRSANLTPPVQTNPGNSAEPGVPVQLKPRNAQVTWATTHLVRVQGHGEAESLFGDDWQSGEVPPNELGQLHQDQMIEVDDAQVFMSRRGGNQEVQERRNEDEDADVLRYEWLKVLRVWSEDAWRPVPEDTYVRAETIRFADARKIQKINVKSHKDQEDLSRDLEEFHMAWQQAAGHRRRSLGHVQIEVPEEMVGSEPITSGWNWDKYDEGVNVSNDMKDPGNRAVFEGVTKQHVLSANYETESEEPAAYMVLEEREDVNKENGGLPVMYIRWLIAHPERGGGASKLLQQAIELFKASQCKILRVDSAYSAVDWYQKAGFRPVAPGKEIVKKGVGYADTELILTK
jgi:hypothetical protein